jgi:hypothetical protein
MLTGLVALAGGGAVAGCSNGDRQVFVTDTAATTAQAETAGDDQAGGSDPSAAGAVSGAVPQGAVLQVSFTFAAEQSQGGPARNPYIAVWIETPTEDMVATIALWHLQQNERWLGELKRWYALAEGQGESVSSATRVPGEYTLEWDCTDAAGTPIAAGEYFVCIEAAREHGPYELIREPLTLADTAAEETFDPSGELIAASAVYTV